MLSKGAIHGIFMMIGWGLLLPIGVLSARLLKHRPNSLWFKCHRAIQTIGLCFAAIGFVIAINSFDVFSDAYKGTSAYKHGCLGVITMVLGLLQPINAMCRPTVGEIGEEKSWKRWRWELFHKGIGYVTLLLAAITIIIGTSFEGKSFKLGYFIGILGTLVLFILLSTYDRFSYQPPIVDETVV